MFPKFDKEALYRRLPISLQNAAASAEGLRLQRYRYTPYFHALLSQYHGRTRASVVEILEFRQQRLREFLALACHSVPFYQGKAKHVDLEHLSDAAFVELFPVLTRDKVQDAGTALYNSALEPSHYFVSHTSGSTGSGLRFPVTHDAHREQWAVWWRYRNWFGIGLDTTCLYFGGRTTVPLSQAKPPFWRHNWPGRQVLFSGYHLSEATALAYLVEMKKYPRAWIHGYPSMVSLMASFALKHGIQLDVAWVTLGAESLLPHQERLIQEAFGVPALQHYGMAEGAANISLCPQGKLHVDEDYSYTEFIPIGDNQYRIVGTNFTNPAYPLIRYDVGDIATITGQRCGCGRPGRVVDAIDGRKEDFVIANDGSYIGRLDHIFKDLVRVREAQVLQERKGHMILRIVKAPGYSDADEQQLQRETRQRVGTNMDFSVEYVASIPRTKSGKVRFVVSTLQPQAIARPS